MDDRADGLRVRGLTVRAEWAFFPVAALLVHRGRTPLQVIQWLVVAAAAIAVTEMGHAWAARRAERRTPSRLVGVGGPDTDEDEPGEWEAARTAVGGPLATLLLVGLPATLLLALGVFDGASGMRSLMVDVAVVNLAWSFFNLLPLLPLDGGRALSHLLGRRIACELGVVVGLMGALIAHQMVGMGVALLLGALGLWNLGSVLRLPRRAVDADDDFPRPPLPPELDTPERTSRSPIARWRARRESRTSEPVVAVPVIERQSSASGPVERRAWSALRSGDVAAAASVCRAPDPLVVCPYLHASIAVAAGDPTGVPALVDALLGPFQPPNLVVARIVAEAGVAGVVADTLLEVPDGAGDEAVETLQTHLQASECGWAAAEVAEVRLSRGPVTATAAFEAACCWAAVGNSERALAKLAIAVEAGLSSASLVEDTPVLAPVRRLPAFSLVRARLV